MANAATTHMGLMRSGQGADEFFLDNFELLKSLLAHASMGAGVVSDGWIWALTVARAIGGKYSGDYAGEKSKSFGESLYRESLK